MPRRVNIVQSTDWLTVILYLILVLMGWLNIYAAVYDHDHQSIFDITQRYGKQLLWISAALILAAMAMLIESKAYSFLAYPLYILMALSLISVLIFGKEVHGSRSWFEIGDFRLQPAEFGKLATSLALARFLSTYNVKIQKFSNLFVTGFILLVPMVLIILQHDTGSAVIYVSFIFVLYREGLPGYYLLFGLLISVLFIAALIFSPLKIIIALLALSLIVYFFMQKSLKQTSFAAATLLIIAGVIYLSNYFFALRLDWYYILFITVGVSGFLFIILSYRFNIRRILLFVFTIWTAITFSFSVDYIFHNVLESHQQTRFKVLLGLDEDPQGAGYNVHQSKIAIGSGGFSGKGYLQGTQTKYNFVPEQDTDFIFCTVGEEWGFLGSLVVVGLFVFLLLRLIFLAERQRSAFSRIYGYSVASIFFFHFAINIGMTIGLAPVIGIPLPFFSYGGSSLWAFTLLLFIFIRLDASRMELL